MGYTSKGWYAVIPFYNLYKLFQATMGNGWYFILALIPVVNIAMFIILNYHLCKAFNKTENTSILAFLLPTIIWPFIGFDTSEYTKPEKKPKVVPEKKVPSPVKKVSGVSKFIKWFITVILILFSLTLIEVFREEKLMGYLILSFIIFIFSLLICPLITSYTQKYDKYTKYKWLVVLILFIILFSIFLFMEF